MIQNNIIQFFNKYCYKLPNKEEILFYKSVKKKPIKVSLINVYNGIKFFKLGVLENM